MLIRCTSSRTILTETGKRMGTISMEIPWASMIPMRSTTSNSSSRGMRSTPIMGTGMFMPLRLGWLVRRVWELQAPSLVLDRRDRNRRKDKVKRSMGPALALDRHWQLRWVWRME